MIGVGKYRRGSEKRRRGKKTGGLNFSNSPSSFFSAKEHFSCCRTNFSSPYMLAIASVLFSNYYASVYNVYYLQLINGGMRGDISTFFSLIFQVTFSRPGNIFIVVPTSSFFMCLKSHPKFFWAKRNSFSGRKGGQGEGLGSYSGPRLTH